MNDIADPRETEHHPRLRSSLYGHQQIEEKFVAAFKSSRLHHAWLLTGPKGIGKATFSYRAARYVLKHGDPASAPVDMSVAPDDGVFRRVAARGHADLLTIERSFDPKTKRLKTEIGVAEARTMSEFFSRTAGEGGWRVCIVDAADELNTTAANALLKILEEPPQRALIMLVAQQSPGRLLATIRSRCITQIMSPLSDELVGKVLAEIAPEQVKGGDPGSLLSMARGSPGRAVSLLNSGSAEHMAAFDAMVSASPPFDRKTMYRLADQLASRSDQQNYPMFCDLLREWIMRQASSEALGEAGEPAAANGARWARLSQRVERSIQQANVLNLDRRTVMLEAFRLIEQTEQSNIRT